MYHKSSTENLISLTPHMTAQGSVIWLHGLGADGNDFAPIVPELNLHEELPLRFIFPHAPMKPVTINNGYVMRAWFDIESTDIHQRVDEKGIQESIKTVHDLIQAEVSLGIPTEKIVLAGFSQGAVIALIAGLTYAEKLKGTMGLSGFLPHAETILNKTPVANKKLPIFIGHGREDFVVPFALGQMTADVLTKYDHPVTAKYYPIAHTVNREEIDDIANWLKNLYQKTHAG
jgi:phospholipase/carboxylesterase